MNNVRSIVDRANSDPTFRSQLKADPAAAFQEAGLELAEGIAVEVIDAHRGDIHILLGGTTNVPELDRIAERAANDAAFKELLLRDPRVAVEDQVGAKLPPTCTVHVQEAAPNTLYLYLASSQNGPRELEDSDLEAISGGSVGWIIFGAFCGWVGNEIGDYLSRPTGTLNELNLSR